MIGGKTCEVVALGLECAGKESGSFGEGRVRR